MNQKEFYDSLSDEMKAKVGACKSMDEFKALLKAEPIEMDPELLEKVSGGLGGDVCCGGYWCIWNDFLPE